MARERRWIILAEDGRYITIGRDTDPSDEEVTYLGEGLRAQGIGGWLAVVQGHYYQSCDTLTLLMVRAIAPSSGPTWEQAEAAFLRVRSDVMCAS